MFQSEWRGGGGCKMKPDELTHGTKPVPKKQWQRKQSGSRKEERERRRMNDGNNDEFSVANKMTEGDKKHEEVYCLCYCLDIYATCVSKCPRVTKVASQTKKCWE